jgi:hypothetical protein
MLSSMVIDISAFFFVAALAKERLNHHKHC